MIMLDVPVVDVAFPFCLADRVFCNPLEMCGLYMLISVCMVIFKDDCIIYYTGLRHHLLMNY